MCMFCMQCAGNKLCMWCAAYVYVLYTVCRLCVCAVRSVQVMCM